ncbi:RNA-directed DNA polymerase, eukaryota [Tanacetum coccineum]
MHVWMLTEMEFLVFLWLGKCSVKCEKVFDRLELLKASPLCTRTLAGGPLEASSLFTSGFILEVEVGSVYISPPPYPASAGLGLFDENPASGSAVGVVHREDASGSNIDIRSEQRQTLRVSEPPVSSEHDLPTHFSSVRSLKQRGSLQSMRNAIVPHVTSENRGVGLIRANETPGWVPDFTDEVDDEDHDEINSMAEEDEVQKSGGMYENYGSPTEEFQFGKGLKQGDPLSPFLFILIMETLHISFQRVVDARMFHGIKLGSLVNLSHMFYADDAVFVGEWSGSNITTFVHVLDCFHKVFGLKINMSKSKIMGFYVDSGRVYRAAYKLGCLVLKTPFLYLGSLVGGNMHRLQAWNDIVDRVRRRLSK